MPHSDFQADQTIFGPNAWRMGFTEQKYLHSQWIHNHHCCLKGTLLQTSTFLLQQSSLCAGTSTRAQMSCPTVSSNLTKSPSKQLFLVCFCRFCCCCFFSPLRSRTGMRDMVERAAKIVCFTRPSCVMYKPPSMHQGSTVRYGQSSQLRAILWKELESCITPAWDDLTKVSEKKKLQFHSHSKARLTWWN